MKALGIQLFWGWLATLLLFHHSNGTFPSTATLNVMELACHHLPAH